MTLRADNRLARPHDDGGLRAMRGPRHGAQEQLESNQRAMGCGGLGELPRARCRRAARADWEHELFLACTALSISISDAVRRGELPIVDQDSTVSGR